MSSTSPKARSSSTSWLRRSCAGPVPPPGAPPARAPRRPRPICSAQALTTVVNTWQWGQRSAGLKSGLRVRRAGRHPPRLPASPSLRHRRCKGPAPAPRCTWRQAGTRSSTICWYNANARSASPAAAQAAGRWGGAGQGLGGGRGGRAGGAAGEPTPDKAFPAQ